MSPLPRYLFAGGTAVLTGAASGIGEHMAHGLAGRGSNLVLLDRDADRLEAVTATIRGRHPHLHVDTFVVDLADTSALDVAAQQILTEHPSITLLINNAGVAMGGMFEELSAEEFDWVIRVNFHAPVTLTRWLLPALRRSPGSHIVNVSSLFGLVAPPGQSAYVSSKYALRGFSEALRHELTSQNIGVTTVHPGGIRTRIAETARVAASIADDQARQASKEAVGKLLTYPADKAASQVLTGIEERRPRVLIGWSAVLPDLIARVFPSSYWNVMSRLRPSTTRKAAGHATVPETQAGSRARN
ncbi:SDR family NAD(P)-dependent oxidoreductase [Streptomyces sp. 900105755]